MLTQSQVAKLERLQNYPTRYEITATNAGRGFLVAYSGRRGRMALLEAVRERAAAVIGALGLPADVAAEFRPGGVMALGEWTVRFSGRTQRQAITEGELEYVGNVSNQGGN